MPQTAAKGTRYSVHDHLFDFSQPEPACAECHDAGDERLTRKPSHQWNFRPVKAAENLTVEQACGKCHQDKGAAWVADKLKGLKKRL